MESRNKFLVKKNSATNRPHHVFSVLNLTTDFLPAQKENLSRFPSTNPKKHRSMDNRMMRKTKFRIPHFKNHSRMSKKSEKRMSFNELLSVKPIDTVKTEEKVKIVLPAKYQD